MVYNILRWNYQESRSINYTILFPPIFIPIISSNTKATQPSTISVLLPLNEILWNSLNPTTAEWKICNA